MSLSSITCCLLLLCWGQVASAHELPNIVLFLVDDLGVMDLGCYGSTFHRTPEIDHMARQGLRFVQAYAASPVCSPTRAALLTGKHPARLHLTDWLPGRGDRSDQPLKRPAFRQQLPLEERCLSEYLRAVGYRTAHIGKWHLGGMEYGPQQQGFEVNIAGDHTGTPLSYFAPYKRQGRTMIGLEDAPDGEYLTQRLTQEAIQFIEQHHQQPFLLYLAHYAVHTPMHAPQELINQFPPQTEFRGQQGNPIYAAMLWTVDQSLARVRACLQNLGIAHKTWIIFTSDNGGLATREGRNTPATSNAPFREGKGWLYEGGLRVPLIIWGPGIKSPGRVVDAPVWTADIFSTILDLCGLDLPHDVDGYSLVGLLTEDQPLDARALYWHYPHYSNQGGRPGGAVRVGDWKWISWYEDQRQELYNLYEDPFERRNQVLERADIAAELARRHQEWLNEVNAQMPEPNPEYIPHPQSTDGVIELPARGARIEGVQLRYEPLPHKDTLGFWTRVEDLALWEFTLKQPGHYRVELLVGCGTGQGGSEVCVEVGEQRLHFTVPDTGGFQQFASLEVGAIHLPEIGRYTLRVKPLTKQAQAVMDLKSVRLLPMQTDDRP